MTETTNIVIDLETMGFGPTSAIVALGAARVEHNTERSGVISSFYRVISLESSIEHGLTLDASTIYWWLSQSESARQALIADRIPLREALRDFGDWMVGMPEALVWGNGADFDNVILANAYRAAGVTLPWAFRNNRCFRTLRNSRPGIDAPPRAGVSHNALDDAVWEAEYLLKLLARTEANHDRQ